MKKNVNEISSDYNFYIYGSSYAGAPRDNTMMYIGKKVKYLVDNLYGVKECLVFIDESISISSELKKIHCFVRSENPQLSYAEYATVFFKELFDEEKNKTYKLTEGGYYVGENVTIGKNSYIEPDVLIGHNVVIGDNAIILSGARIKHAIIGHDFFCNENAVIGDYSFTMADDNEGNRYRIPALGRVIIGDYVEIGACNDVAIGACGDTILCDYVKLDGLVHIGHEAYLGKNTEITAGVIVAGFVHMDENTYIGINSSIKNRIQLGKHCLIGMGSNVTKSVDEEITVVGNPAKPFK